MPRDPGFSPPRGPNGERIDPTPCSYACVINTRQLDCGIDSCPKGQICIENPAKNFGPKKVCAGKICGCRGCGEGVVCAPCSSFMTMEDMWCPMGQSCFGRMVVAEGSKGAYNGSPVCLPDDLKDKVEETMNGLHLH